MDGSEQYHTRHAGRGNQLLAAVASWRGGRNDGAAEAAGEPSLAA